MIELAFHLPSLVAGAVLGAVVGCFITFIIDACLMGR